MERNIEERNKVAPIIGYAFLVLVIGGTVAGFLDIGNFGAIIGVTIAIFITAVILIMILKFGIKIKR